MAPPPDRLYRICADVLAAIEAHYDAQSVGLPGRRYVASGPAIVWDCEQLTVHADRTFPFDGNVTGGSPDPFQAAAGFAARAALIVIELVRCHPTIDDDGDAPPVDAERAAAKQLYMDSQMQVNAIIAGVHDDRLTALNSLAIGDWQGEGPDGGYVGSTLRVFIGTTELGLQSTSG